MKGGIGRAIAAHDFEQIDLAVGRAFPALADLGDDDGRNCADWSWLADQILGVADGQLLLDTVRA